MDLSPLPRPCRQEGLDSRRNRGGRREDAKGGLQMSYRFRLISRSGDGFGLAHILQREGHEVTAWLKDPRGKNLYKGLLPRVKNWRDDLTSDTVLVFDMSGMGKEADEMRAKGYRVIGGSELADSMELDRAFGLAVADNHGIALPEYEEFTDFDAAVEYLQDKDTGFVFKPDDNKPGVRTFVSTSPDQMIAMLAHYKELGGGKFSFVLQQVVEGVEISSEVWCIDGEIVPHSFNNTLEQKRFLNNEWGPMTGCAWSAMKFGLSPRLYDETFKKLIPWLRQVKYCGPLDLNCIIDSTGTPYMLEWTPRFGYSAFYAAIEGLEEPLGEFLWWMAGHEMPEFSPSRDWLGSLRITIPPYPHVEDAPDDEGIPIIGMDLDDDHTVPLDVQLVDDKLSCSGFDGIICELTGRHPDLSVLCADILDRATEIQIPEKQFRTDFEETTARKLIELSDLGYLDGGD